jgi:predicted O-methyltransferase YrrM
MKKTLFGGIVGAIAALVAFAGPIAWREEPPQQARLQEQEEVRKDVPYVPTSPETVAEMLRMAQVASDDLVYDLGSGDGRIVIAAAKEHGARGVGIDIDPVRIREANENARAAGVTDRVTFVEGNLFDADLRDATAVTLYLLPDVNLKLRPKLLAELRPGTPVVSHDFSMGEWQPDERKEIGGDVLMLWIVPARVDGTWTWTDGRKRERTLEVTQQFQKFGGSATGGTEPMIVRSATLNGDAISFELASEKHPRSVERYRGTVAVDMIIGTVERDGRSAPWTARRD